MKRIFSDVDIDCFNRDAILDGLDCAFARIDRDTGEFEKHPTGVYFQNIPKDPFTNIATIDHKDAKAYGFFKIDFLNVNLYEGIESEEHLDELIKKEPEWELFQYEEITEQLFHLKGYSHLLKKFKPKSVEDLAMILAIIRPKKAYLQQADWEILKKEVWSMDDEDEKYAFKRSHGLAYSIAICVHLHLFVEKLTQVS
jgi:DNA polymerase III alpha subunit